MADIGDQLGPYRLDEVIGRGGFATVYRATHIGLQVERAIKVLDRNYADDAQIRQLFQREARRAARLSTNHVVEVHDAGETNGESWIASELMPLGTLADALDADRRFSAPEIRHLGEDLASALAEAHTLGLLHRDVKPANIFLTPNGGAKLGDFGVAAELAGRTHASTMVGTLSHMAPEQDDGQSSPKSDVYSLGAVLYETWTRLRPPTFARRAPTWPPMSTEDSELRELIAAMLSVDPAQRPDADRVIAVLGGSSPAVAVLAPESAPKAANLAARSVAEPTRLTPTRISPAVTSRKRNMPFWIPVIGVLAILLLVAAVALSSGDQPSSHPSASSSAGSPRSSTPARTSSPTTQPTARPTTAATPAPTSSTVTARTMYARSQVPFQSDCAIDSPSRTTLVSDQAVEVFATGTARCSGWNQARTASTTGWLRSSDLTSSPRCRRSVSGIEQGVSAAAADRLRIRATPGLAGTIVVTLRSDDVPNSDRTRVHQLRIRGAAPTCDDGLVWWEVESLYYGTAGWSAERDAEEILIKP